MNVKSSKQLENTLRQALVRVRQDTKQREEKLDKKFWSEMTIPFSLGEGLNTYTKSELDAIRRYLEIKNASSLKKAELIALFQEEIPGLIKRVALKWDDERFSLLVKMARNGGYIHSPEMDNAQIKYLRDTGFIFTGVLNGKRVLALPEELNNEMLTLEDDLKLRSIIKRNTDWIKLTSGLLYYYGTLSVKKITEMLEEYTKVPLHFGDYHHVIQEAVSFHKQIVIDDNGFSNRRVFDSNRVKHEHEVRKNIPFYPFTKEQLMEASDPDFIDRNRHATQLVNFIKQNFDAEKLDVDKIVEECVYATRNGQNLNEVIQYLSRIFIFDREELLGNLVDKVVQLMNNTREWNLKGHTSIELRNLYEKPSKSAEASIKPLINKAKVGRNEPCPCGSGKKYKKCCGR
ncbi:SEC-C metal-binding domain-containing protein [Bacillus nitroreducens]